ncbi:DUF4221 family protein [Mucilaginibacter sp. L3T2-6]|uniref:DUF4221 family protein n=1 Tax=Mucilaginibacter sp. L3T2-6 TaxID=3062491 RepID=UPI002675D068|nr:DUF4221 family protein [Mucilaginibacter sp. L3T2-6]MDO3641299.1 DUF4221 family protein [Mucilaginibacter sp. L3T2-6]MDV6213941.1 DUF4221 family protein [Mucilaginibacter sp. L3T2-6]
MKQTVFLFLSLFIFGACKQHSRHVSVDNKSYKFESQFTLAPAKKVSFLLDSLTNPNIGNTQLFKTDSVTYFTFLNKQFNSIYFYDFKTAKFKFKIDIHTKGANAVGAIVNSYFIKSLDSIYVLSRYVLNIIDHNSHIISKVNFQNNPPDGISGLPQIYCYAPLIQQGDELLLNSVPDKVATKESSFEDKEILLKYNTKTGAKTYEYRYPDAYRDGVFGVNYMYIYHAYNPATKKIVFSFPADNNIYVTGADTLAAHYAGSKFLGEVKPMQKVRDDFDGYNRFFLQSPSYGPIYYDNFRDVYYRFALKPITDKAYSEKKWWKQKSIVILNKDFKKIGEIEVPDTVSFLACLVTEEGLYVNVDDAEDRVSMALYKLVKI